MIIRIPFPLLFGFLITQTQPEKGQKDILGNLVILRVQPEASFLCTQGSVSTPSLDSLSASRRSSGTVKPELRLSFHKDWINRFKLCKGLGLGKLLGLELPRGSRGCNTGLASFCQEATSKCLR